MPLRKRAGRWHYRFWTDNKEFYGSTGLAATRQNRSDAESIMIKRRDHILSGASEGEVEPEAKYFGEARADFLEWCSVEHKTKPETVRRIETSFVSLSEFFETFRLSEIRAASIERFKIHRLKVDSVKSVTARHDLHALSKFFRYCRRMGWMVGDPLEFVRIPSDKDSRQEKVLSLEEEATYFAAAKGNPNLHDVGRLMILQAVRPSEAMGLRQENIDFGLGRHGQLLIETGKSDAARRRLPLVQESRAILEKRLMAPGEWVFPSNRRPGMPICKLNGPHDKICNRLRLFFRLYDLRHTAATRLAAAGVPLTTLAAILGHSSISS